MVIKLYRSSLCSHQIMPKFTSFRSVSSLEHSIKTAVETKAYTQIPELLIPTKNQSLPNPNPFTFLSAYPLSQTTEIIDEILQSFITIRPHSCLKLSYSCLLYYTFQTPNPLPIALSILQRSFRSGCQPEPQFRLLLASAWVRKRRKLYTVLNILRELESIGYYPDCSVCNYVLFSLCCVDQLGEAVHVLKCMSGAGCVPDLESYGNVIGSLCKAGKTGHAVELMKEMVVKSGLIPRQGTLVKLIAALRGNREIRVAVEMIEFLEKEGCVVGFECYEVLVEGCLESKDYVLAAKMVMRMTDKRFIPYIKVRQKVVDRLIDAGAWKIACAVRQRFAELNS
ncbi:pentatricopeptide repeat-containing protein At1g06270 [Mercurialis annua]|uniref:pentatricopeptide repeat-containing protein At1g06270 n=1 Tax=Mercurialis annua TaxID=3986 RepID=UPI00216039C2|nr:pentatricopeptide repeat-containing protein At1g06270 [Mercurialis annua]